MNWKKTGKSMCKYTNGNSQKYYGELNEGTSTMTKEENIILSLLKKHTDEIPELKTLINNIKNFKGSEDEFSGFDIIQSLNVIVKKEGKFDSYDKIIKLANRLG